MSPGKIPEDAKVKGQEESSSQRTSQFNMAVLPCRPADLAVGRFGRGVRYQGGGIGENLSKDFYNTWTYDNTTASLPRVIDGSRNYNTSDLLLQKSDFISLNDVSIGYTLPSDVVEKIGLSKVRIYGLGNNLALWTASGRQGFDPRASVTGGNNSVRYATLKTFTLGLNVNF